MSKMDEVILPPNGSPDPDMMANASEVPQKPKRSMRTLVLDWAEHTGMHGLPNITRNHNPVKKSFWTLLLLAGLGIMVWQIVGIVQKYYSYPMLVQRSVETLMPRPFPAVTVCNLNPARAKQMSQSFVSNTSSTSSTTSTNSTDGRISTRSAATPGPTPAPVTAATTAMGDTTPASGGPPPSSARPGRRKRSAGRGIEPPPPSSDKFSWITGSIYSSNSSKNLSAMGPNAIPESLGITYSFLDYYNSLTGTWKTQVGNQLNDFLIDCSIGNQYCQQQNFSRFLHPLYGNCYIFNAARSDQDPVTVLQSGPLHGLKLTLYIEQTQYVGAIANSAGVVVVVHEPNKQPFPEDTGITVSPGQETYIGLKEVVTKRMSYPYADDCQIDYVTANKENNMYAVKSNFSMPNANYSKLACMKTCMQRKVEKRCRCSSPNLPISDPTVDPLYNSSYAICMYEYNSTSSTISTNAMCAQSAEKDAFTDCTTTCKQDCDEYSFIPSLSHSMWPSDSYENDSQLQIMSYNRNIKETIERMPMDSRRTFMSKNFVKILVFFNDPQRNMVVSSEGYALLDVLSDMGGQVGLWLGLSVLTLFEIVEMFLDLGVLLCKKTRRPTQPADAWKWTAANAMLRAGAGVPPPSTPPGPDLMKQPLPNSPSSGDNGRWYEGPPATAENRVEISEMPVRARCLVNKAFN